MISLMIKVGRRSSGCEQRIRGQIGRGWEMSTDEAGKLYLWQESFADSALFQRVSGDDYDVDDDDHHLLVR